MPMDLLAALPTILAHWVYYLFPWASSTCLLCLYLLLISFSLISLIVGLLLQLGILLKMILSLSLSLSLSLGSGFRERDGLISVVGLVVGRGLAFSLTCCYLCQVAIVVVDMNIYAPTTEMLSLLSAIVSS